MHAGPIITFRTAAEGAATGVDEFATEETGGQIKEIWRSTLEIKDMQRINEDALSSSVVRFLQILSLPNAGNQAAQGLPESTRVPFFSRGTSPTWCQQVLRRERVTMSG